jgi:dephospho-CoA kinase
MPIVIGLTGNIACGKSLIGELLKERGILVLDSDDVVHDIYKNDELVQTKIQKEFGTLDRKQISIQIFGDTREAKDKRKKLEEIIHPTVDKRFRDWIRAHNDQQILVNLVPLVFEAGLESRYNLIITVVATPELQYQRLKKRNPELNEEEIQKRISSQIPQSYKAQKSDYVIENSGSIDDLEEQLEEILRKIRHN